jgi:hypothetical protein
LSRPSFTNWPVKENYADGSPTTTSDGPLGGLISHGGHFPAYEKTLPPAENPRTYNSNLSKILVDLLQVYPRKIWIPQSEFE